jgi:hypothetical protein
LEVADRREPPPSAVDPHAVVVELWWDELVPERDDSERWNSRDEIRRVQDAAYPFAPPYIAIA